jgi:hypothetical protein
MADCSAMNKPQCKPSDVIEPIKSLESRSGALGAEDKVPDQTSEIQAVSATVYRLEIISGTKSSVEDLDKHPRFIEDAPGIFGIKPTLLPKGAWL